MNIHVYKKFILIVLVSIMALNVFYSGQWVHADDGSLGRMPEGVYPIYEYDVEMESEKIIIDLGKNTAECTFIFHNTGDKKVVLMGFPGKLGESYTGDFTEDADLELGDFKAYKNGVELPVTQEKGVETNNMVFDNIDEIVNIVDHPLLFELQYGEWFTFDVPFEADETVIIKNTYSFHSTYYSNGCVYTGYVLKTGALWKGPIGSATVTFKLGSIRPYQFDELYPGGFRYEDDMLIWERKDFEPVYDLFLNYNDTHYSDGYLETPGGESSKKKIDDFNMVDELAGKGAIDELLDMYDEAVLVYDYLLAVYIRSFLPADKILVDSLTLGSIRLEEIERSDFVSDGIYYHISCDVQGADNAIVHLTISHIEYGDEVIDAQYYGSDCYAGLRYGIEYDIVCTLQDWKDHFEQKTLKHTVPLRKEFSEITSATGCESLTEPSSVADPDSSPELQTTIGQESSHGSGEDADGSGSKPAFIIICIVVGTILLVVLMMPIILRSRKK